MFDILRFYQDHKVDYQLEGKNVMEGWVNICCPFCDDKSDHLGVYIKRPRNVKCWRCGDHTIPELLTEFSDKNIKELYAEYSMDGEVITQKKKEKPRLHPKEVTKLFFENINEKLRPAYAKYLRNRNFDADDIIFGWRIYGGVEMGEYKYRLMIPIFQNNKMVSFQGRDITEMQDDKYKTCKGTYVHDYLYGLDYIKDDRCIIVEGVTDVWRLGRGEAVSTFGINYSQKQIILLLEKKIKKVMVFFDSEPQAQKAALKLKGELETYGIEVLNYFIEGTDPAELNEDEVENVLLKLRRM